MFSPLSDKPDHAALEEGILEFWERERIFDQLRAMNADGPRFSFIDGPVTANKSLGVHTAWGRTLKDVFQRYKALQGFHQRYQNGFDCQGLWIEVGVERELGLNSKREIEEYGLENFARKCRAVVEWSAGELTRGSIRLGQWMDWGNDYLTFSDTNIEYIWRFLAIVNERGWLYRGQRVTEWCPRCGTSISAHELVGSYSDREHPSVKVRFPLLDRPGQAVVVWTTTPWTLPANVAVAVNPEAQYGRLPSGDWVAVATMPEETGFEETAEGSDLVGLAYEAPYQSLPAAEGIQRRVLPWNEVETSEGTGVVHIAPGCGAEDFELGRTHDLPVLSPVDEAGIFGPDWGWLAGASTEDASRQIIDDLRTRDILVDAATITHRYPECWRCHTPLIFRVSDDWFIGVDGVRDQLREANATVKWVPDYFGKRMDDWLVNMADWNISRRRYYGLPLPFYPCSCGHLTVIGSRTELVERATGGIEQLEELRRPWIDRVEIRCEACGEEVKRIPEVGDVWLDAGIVPFSTLGWRNPEWVPEGYATGAAKGLTTADLPDDAYWEEWFPADWISEMREQIRLWFYSMLFMSVTLTGRAPFKTVLGYEKMLDEHGDEMHGSRGNMISAEDAFARMGADVMRWQYCSQPPSQDLLFGYQPGDEIKRRLLTLWNSVGFLIQYSNITDFTPALEDLDAAPPEGAHSLDRWVWERTGQLIDEANQAYESYLTVDVLRAFESFVDDVSNWYIRRSRRRFWDGDTAALGALWTALVQGIRVISPVMPFLAEELWQVLVAQRCVDAPRSVFLAGWPAQHDVDAALLADVVEVRKVVELGRQARSTSQMKLRQPLRQLVIDGAGRVEPYLAEIADELRVKTARLEALDAGGLRVRPNLPILGPRLGAQVQVIRRALEAGDFQQLDDGGFDVAGHKLSSDEVLVQRTEKAGWAVAGDGPVTVALDLGLDDELRREARVFELVHRINSMRKEAGLSITDRIKLSLPTSDADLATYQDWIGSETLAVHIDFSATDEPELVPVS